ncbi:unnamed protein product, partial [marine sediment metagenome]
MTAALVVYRHTGRLIDYTPALAVTAGDVVVQGDLVGVALHDIAALRKGALAIEGVFDFPKDTGSSNAITAGAKVYWDAENEVATTTAGENKQIGKAVEAASAD